MATDIKIIRDEAGYRAAMAEFEALFDNEPEAGSEEGDRFELLGLLLAKYEEDSFHMPTVGPAEAIRFAMDRQGLGQSDLAELLGSRSRASEILKGRRGLTLPQIRLLSKAWNIPVQALVAEVEAA
ncbi:helix-turn-helix domain-containing protein [Caulobacter sp. RL271]|jgi:antitoxin component HigA of HigAB toxin-antitoxin module|uniref:Transcriptional regulator n=1 Tax=Caulobacter segnis TaxID=88688 RepID=A0ABY4ZTB0_9CAUL|nr:helix-turn-helix domain-containing protein [Caulobacter segnis]USQ96062.1 transcriptional regulator [Caulobacter segnis]